MAQGVFVFAEPIALELAGVKTEVMAVSKSGLIHTPWCSRPMTVTRRSPSGDAMQRALLEVGSHT